MPNYLFCSLILAVLASVKAVEDSPISGEFYGIPVGQFSTLQHGVRGSVFVVDSKRLRIRNLNYDGQGPAAFFWIGQKGSAAPLPDKEGLKVPNEKGSTKPLEAYSNADIVLTLPKKIATDDIAWLSIWCEQFSVDFGHVVLPATIAVPEPLSIGELLNPFERLSANDVIINDVHTITVENFTYEGLQKEVYFVVGTNADTADKYIKLAPDGQREPTPLGPITGQTFVFTIGQPDSTPPVTVGSYQFFGVHSYSSGKTLSRVSVPLRFNVPPYLKGEANNSSRPRTTSSLSSSSSAPSSSSPSSSPSSSSAASSSSSPSLASSQSGSDAKDARPKSKPASATSVRQANGTVGAGGSRSGGGSAATSQNVTGGPDTPTGRVGGSSGANGPARVDGGRSRNGSRGNGNTTNSESSVPSSSSLGAATRPTTGRGGTQGAEGATRSNNSTDSQSSTRS